MPSVPAVPLMIQHAGSITSPTISLGPPAAAFGAFSALAFSVAGAAGLAVAFAAGAGVAGFSAGLAAGVACDAPVPWAHAVPANSNVDIKIAVSPDFEGRIQTSSPWAWSTRDDVVRMPGA